MSNETDRRSMDDVLASLRRIVRTENGDGTPEQSDRPSENHMENGREDGPLVLTPEMRIDGGPAGLEPSASADVSTYPTTSSVAEFPRVSERESLRELVREIVVEELMKDAADSAMRRIIRDELTTGETGSNVSQNVQRMIRAEIAKALEER